MFRVFQEEKLITICMFAFLVGSILLRVFLGLLYRNMIKEAENMASTRNRLLKQCKTKFASCYQLGNGVANIPVFVDKFLNRMALGRLSFETIYHMSGQMMLLSVVFSGIGVCKSIIGGRTVGEVLPFYIVSFFGLYVYFSVSTVVNVRGKRRVLKINLVDYLENHLSPRIEVTRQDMEMLYGEAAFEEKRRPYGRVQGGRSSKGKGRRRGRGTQAVPEKRRTVELMPIESRMAVGGEFLQEEAPAEANWQVETAGQARQAAWEENDRQVRENTQADNSGQISRMWGDGTERRAMGMSEDRLGEEAGAQGVSLSDEEAEMKATQMSSSESPGQPGGAGQAEENRQEQNGGQEGKKPEQGLRLAEPQWGQQQPEWGQQQPQWGQQQPQWGQSGQQSGGGFQAEGESPEDSAAVTEEELEALLKEFLTT